MKIPPIINILGIPYKVRYRRLAKEQGVTRCYKRTITIDEDIEKDIQDETFLHEIGHAILGQTGVSATLTTEQEEAVVQSYAIAIHALIKEKIKDDKK
jgi:hypothetical protein